MKKLLFIFFLFFSLRGLAQFPINATTGTSTSTVLTRGISAADSAFQYRTNYSDTSIANLGLLDQVAGVVIRTNDTLFWVRNSTLNRWVPIGSGGGGSVLTPSTNINITGTTIKTTDSLVIVAGGEPSYYFRHRLSGLGFPVATIKPTAAGNMAVDIMPFGTPGNFLDNGISWLDVCDANVVGSSVGAVVTARVGISGSAVQLGMRAFGGAAEKKLNIIMGTDSMMTFNTDRTIDVNTADFAISKNTVGNNIQWLINPNTGNSASIWIIAQDFAANKSAFIRYENEGQTGGSPYQQPNQVEFVTNVGATNGMVLGTLLSGSPFKFLAGSTERLRLVSDSILWKTPQRSTSTTWIMAYDSTNKNMSYIRSNNFSGVNIYNSDGTLSGARTLTGAGNSLSFSGVSNFSVDASATTSNGMDLIVNTLTSGIGLHVRHSANTFSSGTLLQLSSTSTGLAAGNEGLNIDFSGTNGTSAITATGARISVANAGTTSTNVALSLSATNGTTANYALIVPASSGNVGVGTSTPSSGNKLHVVGDAGNVAIVGTETSGGVGVYGQTDNNIGVQGVATANNGVGVRGESTGGNTNNVGGSFIATGATNNYALIVPSASGKVGFGTATPTAGILHIVSPTTTGTTTTSGIVIESNSLTSGTGIQHSSTSLTSGKLANIVSTSTVLAAGNTGLNIDFSGANGTNAITATGATISVTNTNATSGSNYGLTIGASGATTSNRSLNITAGDIYLAGGGQKLTGAFSKTPTGDGLEMDWTSGTNTFNIVSFRRGAGAYGNLIMSSLTELHTASSGGANTLYLANGNVEVGSGTAATSNFHVTGSFALTVTTSAVDINVTASHYTILLTATGKTATLPTAVGITGRIYTIKVTAAGTGTVATTSSQTIDGSTTYSLSAQYKYVTVQSDGANWSVIANN